MYNKQIKMVISGFIALSSLLLFKNGEIGYGILVLFFTGLIILSIFKDERIIRAFYYIRKNNMDKAAKILDKIKYPDKLIKSQEAYFYYLNGLVQSVRWLTEENKLSISFTSENKDIAGDLVCDTSPVEDSEIAIFDTAQLNKLISVTNGELLLTLEKEHKVYSKLHIQDNSFNVAYSLADSLLVPKRGTINFPTDYDVIIELTPEIVSNFIKAKSALTDISDVMISTEEDPDRGTIVQFAFGDLNNFSNKIKYIVDENITINKELKLPFNSDSFKNILAANKDLESGKLSLTEEGFMKLEFQSEDIKTLYYMVRKEDATYV